MQITGRELNVNKATLNFERVRDYSLGVRGNGE